MRSDVEVHGRRQVRSRDMGDGAMLGLIENGVDARSLRGVLESFGSFEDVVLVGAGVEAMLCGATEACARRRVAGASSFL